MLKKVMISLTILILLILGIASTKESKFQYERSGIIHASKEKIFPYLSQFKLGSLWSPYEKVDLKMSKKYSEKDGIVGSTMEFSGNSDVGTGKLEILKLIPNEFVEIKLTMTKPFNAENIIQYKLTTAPEGTIFNWSMSGDGGFLGKVITIFINCEKMVGDQFNSGITNLKQIIEAQ